MKEHRVNDQYSVYYEKVHKNSDKYVVEIHNFPNLYMKRTIEDKDTLEDIKNNPQDYLTMVF